VRAVLPLTEWWERLLRGPGATDRGGKAAEPPSWLDEAIGAGALRERLVAALAKIHQAEEQPRGEPYFKGESGKRAKARRPEAPTEVVWMARIIGWLAWTALAPEPDLPEGRLAGAEAFHAWRQGTTGPRPEELVAALFDLLAGDRKDATPEEALSRRRVDPEARVYLVNRNRRAQLAVRESRLAIKADAAWRLFDISCGDLTWAVIDSGIDASHPAFRKTDRDTGKPYAEAFDLEQPRGPNFTRVARTFDFTRVRLLLNPALLDPLVEEAPGLEEVVGRLVGEPDQWPAEARQARQRQLELLTAQVADLRRLVSGEGAAERRLLDQLDDLRKRLKNGRDVDWALLEPFLEVHPHQYWIPASDHGTHVAAILAGDWEHEGKRYQGMCPDLEIYDLRVMPTGRPGPEDEFNVIAALQFVRHLNRQKDHFVVHGVNLSLSIPHEVANFACGRTPVCDEASRVAAAGVVVVAAAGNNGFLRYQTTQGEREGYHTISITDPGNAEAVITVGATHRNRPHTFGVSYFSSRGPTGDGRPKPDLVAPGEKISAAVPGDAVREKDGTSMAAPHVSGAAAILLARHRELIGQPERIKEVLCASATDLGREHYFQGHGMLDVLRALQSV
jgi:subtilisin family serine protease